MAILKYNFMSIEHGCPRTLESMIFFKSQLRQYHTPMFEPDELRIVPNPAWSVEATGTPMTCVDYSSDGALVAYSNKPGIITVASSYDGSVKRNLEQSYSSYPITGCRFHPSEDSLLLASCRDGNIILFNILKGETTAQTRHLGSQLLAMNVDSFGEIFAIGCADGSVRIYDLENLQRTKALVKMISRSSTAQTVNIYSLVFHPEDSNVLLAAGWNDRVLFWDIRTGNPERSIAGPHIRGPGLDFHNNSIITASARDKKQIEIWDYGTAKKVRDIPIDPDAAGRDFLVNSVKIARNGLDFVAGSAGTNIGLAYEFSHGVPIGNTPAFSSPVCMVGMSPFGSGFTIGTETGEAQCYMIRLKPN